MVDRVNGERAWYCRVSKVLSRSLFDPLPRDTEIRNSNIGITLAPFEKSGSRGPGFALSQEGMIYANAVGKIRNPNIEIRNKYQMSK
jgi:hypothetical protein